MKENLFLWKHHYFKLTVYNILFKDAQKILCYGFRKTMVSQYHCLHFGPVDFEVRFEHLVISDIAYNSLLFITNITRLQWIWSYWQKATHEKGFPGHFNNFWWGLAWRFTFSIAVSRNRTFSFEIIKRLMNTAWTKSCVKQRNFCGRI